MAMFSDRQYARNSLVDDFFDFYIYSFLLAISIGLYNLIPFKLIGLSIVGGAFVALIQSNLSNANQLKYALMLWLMLSIYGYHTNFNLGLQIFGYHFEKYIYLAVGAGAMLSLLRRSWNFMIWKLLDNIQGREHEGVPDK